jgi:hypothetical protein
LAYILKSTQCPSLLTRPRPPSYRQAIGPQNGASNTTSKIDNKDRIEEQFISSQAFQQTPGERIQETTAGEQFEL